MSAMGKPVSALVALLTSGAAVCSGGMALVRDNQPAAAIVVPDDPLPGVSFAARELQYHLRRASGTELPILREKELTSRRTPLVFLGNCGATKQAGIKTKWDVPNSFLIKLMGKRFFMVGDDTDGPVLSSRGIEGSLHDNKTRVGTLFAVYEFLDTHLGVRWLWPGRLGEVIPPHDNVTVDHWDRTYQPQLVHTRIRDYYAHGKGWNSLAAGQEYHRRMALWMRRHRMAQGADFDFGHSFHDWWERYGPTHPEYFALRPDGVRAPNGRADLVCMCVAEPKLWQQIIDNWVAEGSGDWLNCAANDADSLSVECTCANCRAWDVPGAPDLSDRYARFWLQIQEMAAKVNPDVHIVAYAYGVNAYGPQQTRLNDHIVLGVVPRFYFPWTQEHIGDFERQWAAWSDAGASLYLRPNWFHFGHNFPVNFAREFIDAFHLAYQRNMIATDFDARLGSWATQGLNCYALARVHSKPDLGSAGILNEYYAGFGTAQNVIEDYWQYWHEVSYVSQQTYDDAVEEYRIPDNAEHRLHLWFDEFYPPEVMARGRQLLDQAGESAGQDREVLGRIEFLVRGLHDVQLTIGAARAYREHQAGQIDTGQYVSVLKELRDCRRLTEPMGIVNARGLMEKESKNWDYDLIDRVGERGQELDGPWAFRFDPQGVGVEQGWYEEDFDDDNWETIETNRPWEDQQAGKQWKARMGIDYDGWGWYRTRFTLDSDTKGKRVGIAFGAVDEACTVWVNGHKVLERPYPYQGNKDSWNQPFQVDIGNVVQPGSNVLAIRVEDNSGAGGVFKPVHLLK